MSDLPQFLQTALFAAPLVKYSLLFVGVAIEGPLLTMVAGWGVSAGVINPLVALGVILLADVISDSLYYAGGRWGRGFLKKLPLKVQQKLPIAKFKRIEGALHRNPAKTITLSKWSHVAGIPFLISAGAARIPFATFLLYDTLATIPKSLVFFLIGYYSGESIEVINRYLEYGTIIITGWLILLCIAYLIFARYIDKRFFSK